MEKHEYYSEDFEESEIHVIDGDHNDYTMAVSKTVSTPLN